MASLQKVLGVAALAALGWVSVAQVAHAGPPPRKVFVGLLTSNPQPHGPVAPIVTTSNIGSPKTVPFSATSNRGTTTTTTTGRSAPLTTTAPTTTTTTTPTTTSSFLAPTGGTTAFAPFLGGNPPASIMIP